MNKLKITINDEIKIQQRFLNLHLLYYNNDQHKIDKIKQKITKLKRKQKLEEINEY